ncbi:helix-turn-helix domain-containing protein [Kribbella sp. NPDC003557]|uniref:helix-turn-helix transcriptional regulator n=1 Tax=Kribbella sp. NPDC003557 TaxID=3154449 RepID=UPI0033A6234A
MNESRDARILAIAALEEPTRRRLYDHVVRQTGPVTRDEAAAALELPRSTAAFHLDRLAEEGLLEVVFERRTGRSGPGAGRPSKLYQRSSDDIGISLPERRYDLVGGLLAAALEDVEASGESPRVALDRRARQLGTALAAAVDDTTDDPASPRVLMQLLEDQGFEPRADADAIVLGNCPFHTLARQHTDLVCEMNRRLLEGVLAGLGITRLQANLKPAPNHCCVRLEPDTRRPPMTPSPS